MGSINGGMNVIPDDKPGEEIDEDDEVPPDIVDEQFRPVAAPHEISLPYVVAGFLQGRWSSLIRLNLID